MYDIVELRGAPYPELQKAIIEKMSDLSYPISHDDIRIIIVAFSKYYPARGLVRETLTRFEEVELVKYNNESLVSIYKALLDIQKKTPLRQGALQLNRVETQIKQNIDSFRDSDLKRLLRAISKEPLASQHIINNVYMSIVNLMTSEEGISTELLHEWLKVMLNRGRFRFSFTAREALARTCIQVLQEPKLSPPTLTTLLEAYQIIDYNRNSEELADAFIQAVQTAYATPAAK